MLLSIIIASYNTRELLEQCLDSVIKSFSYHPDSSYRHPDPAKGGAGGQDLPTEIIVVDNHSQDNTVVWLKKYIRTSAKIRSKIGVDLSLIVNNDNLGFAKANNQGIKVARGKYILLLNSDTIVKDGALEKMVKFMEDNPEVGGLSPLLLNADGSAQIDYYMRFPNLWQIFFYHNRLLRPLAMKSPLAGLICFPAKKVPYPVDQLPGAAMMVRAKVWQKVGPLDEDYPFYFEDVDWSWRAKKMGQKLMVLPQAEIIHLGGGSWKKGEARPEKYYRQFFASMAIFLKKSYPPLRREMMLGAIKANLWLKSFIKKLLSRLRGDFLITCCALPITFLFFP
jgi:GT2 family glycosyltransferase